MGYSTKIRSTSLNSDNGKEQFYKLMATYIEQVSNHYQLDHSIQKAVREIKRSLPKA